MYNFKKRFKLDLTDATSEKLYLISELDTKFHASKINGTLISKKKLFWKSFLIKLITTENDQLKIK